MSLTRLLVVVLSFNNFLLHNVGKVSNMIITIFSFIGMQLIGNL